MEISAALWVHMAQKEQTPHSTGETTDTNCGPDTKLEVKSIEILCCVTTVHVISLLSTGNIENPLYYTSSMFTQSDWQAFRSAAAKPTHTTMSVLYKKIKLENSVFTNLSFRHFSLNNS